MARTRTGSPEETEVMAEVVEDQDTNFGAAPAPDGTAEIEVWQASPSQWRRRLTEAELLEWLSRHVGASEEDDEAKMLAMFGRAAAAETIDALLTGASIEKGRELPDCILAVDAIDFTVSDKEEGFPFYAILRGKRTDTGDAITVSIGGAVVMGQLTQMHYLCEQLPAGSPFVVPEGTPGALAPDSYPVYLRIKQSAPNAKGNRTNMLVHPTKGTLL